jgi:transcriptional regulator with GAF, ATPase, and Fis domain
MVRCYDWLVRTKIKMQPRDQTRDANTIYQLAKDLLQMSDHEQMLDALMRTVLPFLGAERGFLVLLQKNGTLRFQVIKNWQQEELLSGKEHISRTVLSNILQGGSPILIEDALQDPRFESAESVRSLEIRSILAAPLTLAQRVVGALYLESRNPRKFFGQEEFKLFEEVLSLAHRILALISRSLLQSRPDQKQNDLFTRYQFPGFVTQSESVLKVLEMSAQVARSSLPILLQGASGTGKELLARAIHINSDRAQQPFIVVNCGAISPNLLESELFGYVKGAFTGATQNKEGLIAAAHNGTLFLDEIGELPKELQVKLLRVLQFGEVTPVGATRSHLYSVRFLAATNRDLESEVKRGTFREDLFFRLNAVTLTLPTLKERPNDVLPIFYHFLQKTCEAEKREPPEVSDDVEGVLQSYDWPGNVRELENEARRLVALTPQGSPLSIETLSPRITKEQDLAAPRSLSTIEEQEKALIEHHLKISGGNRTHTAQSLGITREGLRKKMKRFGIQ